MYRMKTTVLPSLPEKLLTRAQVAELFGVTKHTIRMFERRGQISALRINARIVRYRACDIQKLLEQSQS
jgi:DNA-binding transcriptional MerR regulator